jgi:hypothetical protein
MELDAGKIAATIESLIAVVHTVHEALSQPAADPATGLAVAKVPLESVNRLKNVIDQFRLFLWAYVDSRVMDATDAPARLRHMRMERAADMLNQLSADFRVSGVPTTEDAARLREQIRAISPVIGSGHSSRLSGTGD